MLEHKCEICGRMSRKKMRADGKIVCNKHYKQFKKHHKFLDSSPRAATDKNDITICDNIAYIDLYDKHYNIVAKAIIDSEEVNKVKNIKWHINCNGYVVNNSQNSVFLHRLILNTNFMVDHINGNRLDNRKENLRIVNHSQNQTNVNYKGVYQNKTKWIAKIKLNQKQVHLGTFAYYEEALYARWIAERILFREFAFNKPEPNIVESRKKEIKELVENKVQRLQ